MGKGTGEEGEGKEQPKTDRLSMARADSPGTGRSRRNRAVATLFSREVPGTMEDYERTLSGIGIIAHRICVHAFPGGIRGTGVFLPGAS
ncbi:MAG: hypothetical protein Q4C47_01690 [Planctomycetia bacterium]|nr:hypothetical protein [Planctomycetia bacterium]